MRFETAERKAESGTWACFSLSAFLTSQISHLISIKIGYIYLV